jgi:hypothetical protein
MHEVFLNLLNVEPVGGMGSVGVTLRLRPLLP